ncbi:MAG: ribonuclease Z [Candidatus Caldarchaeales archaeon]
MSTLKLTFLGTGGGTPSISRGLPSISINFSGELILLDCGESTQRQMMKAGVGFKSKFTIFLTHLHGDHVLGLPGLLYTLSMLDRSDPIIIYGPKGIEEFVEMFKITRYGKIKFEVEVRRVREGIIHESKDYVVEAIKSNHTLESFCYMFREKDRVGKVNVEYLESIGLPRGPLWGKLQKGEKVEWMGREIKPQEAVGPPRPGRKIVYTGDTVPEDRIVDFARGADVLIHDSTFDSSFEKEAAEQGHSTSVQAAEIARRAGVKRLYLFHISPRYERNPDKLLREAIKIFPETYLAEDLLSYLVPYSL